MKLTLFSVCSLFLLPPETEEIFYLANKTPATMTLDRLHGCGKQQADGPVRDAGASERSSGYAV